MTHRTIAGLRPKSQVLEVAAFGLWLLVVCAITSQTGIGVRSGGLPLVLLATTLALLYLTGGKHIDIDHAASRVRTRWRFAGLALGATETRMDIRRLELRPEWMTRTHSHYVDSKGTVVYDLVLVGGEHNADDEYETVIDLKEDQILFRLAERSARDVARILGLPLAVRWDRLFPDIAPTVRRHGEWTDPIAYPPELGDWRRWL